MHGAMFCLIIMGSDKTTVSVATGQNEYYPLYITIGNVTNSLRRAHAVHPIAAYQVEYSPFCLEIESDTTGLLKTCRELGIAVIAYSPLGRGLLTGAIVSCISIPVNAGAHSL